jgi:hypothetical protein
MGTQASASNSNAKKPVIQIASENDASSSKGSGESSEALPYSDDLSTSPSNDEEEQSNEPAGHG